MFPASVRCTVTTLLLFGFIEPPLIGHIARTAIHAPIMPAHYPPSHGSPASRRDAIGHIAAAIGHMVTGLVTYPIAAAQYQPPHQHGAPCRPLPMPAVGSPPGTQRGGGKHSRREISINAVGYFAASEVSDVYYPPIMNGRYLSMLRQDGPETNCFVDAGGGLIYAWPRVNPFTHEAPVSEMSAALKAGDQLLSELVQTPPAPGHKAPTMGNLKRCSYTHDALIDLIIKHPELDQNHLAAHFGYTPGWISNILAADAFQERMAERKGEIIDPVIRATIEERFRALTIRSLEVLQSKLNAATVSDNVALRAAELGAKALGVGGHAAPKTLPATDRLEKLAERLVVLHSGIKERILNEQDGVQVLEIKQQ